MTPLEQLNQELTTTIVAICNLLIREGVFTEDQLRDARIQAISQVEQNFAKQRDKNK
jgi:hypothetical protein